MSAAYTTAHGNAGSPGLLSEAKDQIHILMDISQVSFCLQLCAHSYSVLFFPSTRFLSCELMSFNSTVIFNV